MKKKVNTADVMNELSGSVFFGGNQPSPEPQEEEPGKDALEQVHDTTIPRYHDTTTPRHHDTIQTSNDELLEVVRKSVKQIGKEAATQRLTLEEKQAITDIEYSYKRQGIKTSGNEIMRIATNYIVEDYKQNGENSILANILKRLNF